MTGFDLRSIVPAAHCVPISSAVKRYEIEVTVRNLGAGVFPVPNERTVTGASLVKTMWNRGIIQTEPMNPRVFVFSRGLDGKPRGGVPVADVMNGLDNKVWLDQVRSESWSATVVPVRLRSQLAHNVPANRTRAQHALRSVAVV